MPTYTTYYGLAKPLVNDPIDEDLWGNEINDDMDTIDTVVRRIQGFTYTKTTDYTLLSTDNCATFLVDATSGNKTITADATLGDGFNISIIKIDSSSNTVTFDPSGSQTVNGAANLVLTEQYEGGKFTSNNANWFAGVAPQIEFANAAQVLAGSATDLIVSPGAFFGNASLGDDGYYKFPGGFTVQWGKVENVSESPAIQTVTFPTAFATKCVFATVQKKITTSGSQAGRDSSLESLSTTGFTYQPWYSGSGGAVATVYWAAIGY